MALLRRSCGTMEAYTRMLETGMMRVLGLLRASLFVTPVPVAEAGDFQIHVVESEYQKGKTEIRVLLPDKLEKDVRCPVIYVLPVEPKNETRFGDGLVEIKQLGLHNKRRVIFVAPTFSDWPWYADHPTDVTIRQETHLLKMVVPFVEKTYPAITEAPGRLLLGFSKSGWGAWSLLLRHPDIFGKAVAWDAPLMMDKPGSHGSGTIFGTPENFEQYQVTKLLEQRAADLGKEKRLILPGVGNFGDFRHQHENMHKLLNEKKIPHVYIDGPVRKHDWHSGWVEEGVKQLLEGTFGYDETVRAPAACR